MREIFLGRPLHWALLAIAAVVLWATGEVHWHVSRFNLFTVVVLALAIGIVVIVVFGHRKGELVTREPPPDVTDD